MAEMLTLVMSVQSILKHINSITFDLQSLPQKSGSGSFGLSIVRLTRRLCSARERLKAWQSLWLKAKVDESSLSIQLWGRAATLHIQKTLHGMFEVSVKIDGSVSTLCTHAALKSDSARRRFAFWREKSDSLDSGFQGLEATCEYRNLILQVESLTTSTEHLDSLTEIAFHVHTGDILRSSGMRAALETSSPALAIMRGKVQDLAQFCASDGLHLDIDLVPPCRVGIFDSNVWQSSIPLFRACHHFEDDRTRSTAYDFCVLPASIVPKSLKDTALGKKSAEAQEALGRAATFIVPPTAAIQNPAHELLAEFCSEVSEDTRSGEIHSTFRTEIPLLESRGPVCMREKVSVAHGIATHGLLLLGGDWGDCFSAFNLRRRVDSQAHTKWLLHVHDPTAGLPHFERSLCNSFESQILDIGLLLIGIALNGQVFFEGEDALEFASRVLPMVERSMGTRYKLACMFCLMVEQVDLQLAGGEKGQSSDVVTSDGRNVLHLFYVQVCQRLEQQLQAIDGQR